jgi:hypothetical protein
MMSAAVTTDLGKIAATGDPMPERRGEMKATGILVLSVTILAGALAIPAASESMAPAQGAPAPQNLQVLPPDTDIRMTMQAYAAALGVQCTYCHIQGDFPSDENPNKETARLMIRMVNAINAGFLDGRADCMLCHRGSAIPEGAAD